MGLFDAANPEQRQEDDLHQIVLLLQQILDVLKNQGGQQM